MTAEGECREAKVKHTALQRQVPSKLRCVSLLVSHALSIRQLVWLQLEYLRNAGPTPYQTCTSGVCCPLLPYR